MSRVRIEPATLRDMTYIAANMREADRREIGAVIEASDTEIGAMFYQASPGFAWVAWLDGRPVCAFGVATIFRGLGSGWAYGTKEMPHVMRAVTRFSLRAAVRAAAVFRRVEVRTLADHDLSRDWLNRLGFRLEGVASDYGRGDGGESCGMDFLTYAATRRSAARLIGT